MGECLLLDLVVPFLILLWEVNESDGVNADAILSWVLVMANAFTIKKATLLDTFIFQRYESKQPPMLALLAKSM